MTDEQEKKLKVAVGELLTMFSRVDARNRLAIFHLETNGNRPSIVEDALACLTMPNHKVDQMIEAENKIDKGEKIDIDKWDLEKFNLQKFDS